MVDVSLKSYTPAYACVSSNGQALLPGRQPRGNNHPPRLREPVSGTLGDVQAWDVQACFMHHKTAELGVYGWGRWTAERLPASV